ncbi:hypothetical protein KCU90_g1644, partial [Aureobasidium melanogenum]
MRIRRRTTLHTCPCLIRKRDQRNTRDRRQTLLPTRDHRIDPPRVHLQRHRAQRAHRVDNDQRARRFRQRRNVLQVMIPHGVGRLALHHRDNLRPLAADRLGNRVETRHRAVLDVERDNVCTNSPAHLRHPLAEKTVPDAQHARAFPRQVGDRHFHRG